MTTRRTESETIAMGPKTILVVDDEKMLLKVSREMLELLGVPGLCSRERSGGDRCVHGEAEGD